MCWGENSVVMLEWHMVVVKAAVMAVLMAVNLVA